MVITHTYIKAPALPHLGIVAILVSLVCPAYASTPLVDASMFSYAGFGTVGVVHSDQRYSDYVRNNIRKPNGPGYSNAWSAVVDSNVGLQLMFNCHDLSAVVQVVAEQQWNKNYKPEVEWANIQYGFTRNFSARIGRIVLPTFMMTESAKVGYANTMVRVPIDAYGDVPITNNDGIDATYRLNYGKINNSTTVHYGVTKAKGVSGLYNEARKIIGFANDVEYGPYKLHVGYSQFKLTVPTVANLPIPSLAALGKADAKVMSVGLAYDEQDLFASVEMTTLDHVLPGKKRGWYVLGGYRIDAFTPYIAYSAQKQITRPSPVFQPVNQQSAIVGVRWDFYKNTDLKVQVEQIRTDADSRGAFKSYPGNQPGTTTRLLSLAVDFVF